MKKNNTECFRTKKEIRNFFQDQNVIYIKRARIACEHLLSRRLDKSPYYLENQELFVELAEKYSDHIKNCRMAPIYIKKVDDTIGYGVFAAKNIKKDEFIGEYAGVVQAADENSGIEQDSGGYESDFSWYYLDEVEDCPDLEINGLLEGNELRFVNHSPSPNLEVEHTLYDGQWIIFFKAAQNIKKDRQILIDYGHGYWDDCRTMEEI